jgi:hypothetical protein
MNKNVKALWAKTRIKVWPDEYVLVSLSHDNLPVAASLMATSEGQFSAIVVEKDEVSLTVSRDVWSKTGGKIKTLASDGPYRVLTPDLNIDLNVSGYLLPAAERLAKSGMSIVPQCAYLKDHLLIQAGDTERARSILEQFIEECAKNESESPS